MGGNGSGRAKGSYTTQQHQTDELFTQNRYSNVTTTDEASFFERGLTTPAIGMNPSLFSTKIETSFEKNGSIQEVLSNWEALKKKGRKPLNVSKSDRKEAGRREFLIGCYALGLIGRNKQLKPQQLLVADVVNAANQYLGILMPRRSTKTTSLFALAIGRCFERPDYLVGYASCVSGLKGRDRFKKDIIPVLQRVFPDEKASPFKIVRSGGSERIEFANGSIFQILPPDGEKFRSDAFDLIIFDEAGEASPAMSEELIAGALPTFDTRPGAQLVIAGTAAKYRKGNLLWDQLEPGREKAKGTGILEYAAPDSTSEEDLNNWDTVKRLVMASHPGIGTLTTIDVVHERWLRLTRAQFAAEYLSIFGTSGATAGIVNLVQWAKGTKNTEIGSLDEMLPRRFAVAFHVHPEQTSSCIVAVWREEGRAKILVLEHQRGVNWLAKRIKIFATKYRMIPIAHDTNGPVTVEAETIGRMRPSVKLVPQTFGNVKTASALIIKEIEDGNVDHWNQEPLNEAARLAKKRSVGPTAWALGRVLPEDDIIALEAAALALRTYDDMKSAGRAGVVIAA